MVSIILCVNPNLWSRLRLQPFFVTWFYFYLFFLSHGFKVSFVLHSSTPIAFQLLSGLGCKLRIVCKAESSAVVVSLEKKLLTFLIVS